jgi:hypothetical protein
VTVSGGPTSKRRETILLVVWFVITGSAATVAAGQEFVWAPREATQAVEDLVNDALTSGGPRVVRPAAGAEQVGPAFIGPGDSARLNATVAARPSG